MRFLSLALLNGPSVAHRVAIKPKEQHKSSAQIYYDFDYYAVSPLNGTQVSWFPSFECGFMCVCVFVYHKKNHSIADSSLLFQAYSICFENTFFYILKSGQTITNPQNRKTCSRSLVEKKNSTLILTHFAKVNVKPLPIYIFVSASHIVTFAKRKQPAAPLQNRKHTKSIFSFAL